MIDHPALPFLKRDEKGKVVSAADAVKLIRDGDTLATGGFVGIGFAEEIAIAIEQRFVFSRDAEASAPGHITRVGLGTFVDPRNGGGKLNEKTKQDIVRLMEIDGEEYLFYKRFPINVGIIRATTGDPDGNLTMEKEALTL